MGWHVTEKAMHPLKTVSVVHYFKHTWGGEGVSLLSIFKRYRWRISFTALLVLSEAVGLLLLPLVIGFAIDGLLADSYRGVWQLTVLGLVILFTGSLRRFYDTRLYSGIYVNISTEIAEQDNTSDTSTLNARILMLKELVDFFENSFPELIVSLIGLVGTVAILYTLDVQIFLGCLAVLVLIIITFALTSQRTTHLNKQFNNTLEKQVSAVEHRHTQPIRGFMTRLMRWNIKLSDLETIIFGVIWLGMVMLIVFSVVQAVGDGSLKTGEVMAIVMYVFHFAEGTGLLPLFYQQFLRLQEIASRLKMSEDKH